MPGEPPCQPAKTALRLRPRVPKTAFIPRRPHNVKTKPQPIGDSRQIWKGWEVWPIICAERWALIVRLPTARSDSFVIGHPGLGIQWRWRVIGGNPDHRRTPHCTDVGREGSVRLRPDSKMVTNCSVACSQASQDVLARRSAQVALPFLSRLDDLTARISEVVPMRPPTSRYAISDGQQGCATFVNHSRYRSAASRSVRSRGHSAQGWSACHAFRIASRMSATGAGKFVTNSAWGRPFR